MQFVKPKNSFRAVHSMLLGVIVVQGGGGGRGVESV